MRAHLFIENSVNLSRYYSIYSLSEQDAPAPFFINDVKKYINCGAIWLVFIFYYHNGALTEYMWPDHESTIDFLGVNHLVNSVVRIVKSDNLLPVDLKKPWNLIAKMIAESRMGPATTAINQKWWR